MNVQSLTFLVFLTGTVCLCRMAGRWGRQWQITLLLAASLIFYLWGGTSDALWGCGLLACSAMVTLLAANALQKKRSRSVLAAAACWHLAVLMLFKYTGFLSGGAVRVPFVPMGISFFTFQQLWYLHEVYTGAFAEVPPAADYLTYSLFFPTVSSGPILKPQSFFPQIEAPISPTGHDTAAGLYAVSRGLAKKVLLADNLGILVNNGWENLSGLTAMTAWFVILGYSLQLYFDFSGYCDIAAGCARLLGLRLPVNFDSPYRSLSVTEFWKRWHMTLTSFLRENVYFPLGGSRRGQGRTYLNILVVYLISGIWHGAGWTFIVWGLLHGAAQVTERLWGGRRDALPKWLRWVMTFFFLNLAWVFFRAPNLTGAAELLGLVGLSDKAKSYPSQLSGGQKQRVAIARALSTSPKYLLCDEATSALDPNTTRSILELLRQINRDLGVTIIIITHEMKVIDQICDRVAVIDHSSIAEEGKVSDVFTNPQSQIARELILPQDISAAQTSGGAQLRIIFSGENAKQPVLSQLTLECQVPVNILFADTKEVEGKAYGQMLLELLCDEGQAEKVRSWLRSSGIQWKEESK